MLQVLYTAVTFVLHVGVCTGQRHGAFSISLNERCSYPGSFFIISISEISASFCSVILCRFRSIHPYATHGTLHALQKASHICHLWHNISQFITTYNSVRGLESSNARVHIMGRKMVISAEKGLKTISYIAIKYSNVSSKVGEVKFSRIFHALSESKSHIFCNNRGVV